MALARPDPRRHDGSLARSRARLAGDAGFAPILSLAGRTTNPRPQPIPDRIGGFGGIDGLVRFLRDEAIDAVIDATHPYADQMSAHAVAACRETGVPLALAGAARMAAPRQATAGRSSPISIAAAERARAPNRGSVFLSLGPPGAARLRRGAAAPLSSRG